MKKILISIIMIAGVTALVIGVSNAFFSDTEKSLGNTFVAGTIDLKVDSECTYNGEPSDQCGTWDLTDLGPESQFFNFTDVKPGDYGENTISLHVDNNEAYVCAIIDNMHDDDNGLTGPEADVDYSGGPDEGELSQELHFFAWDDGEGDKTGPVGNNEWDQGEEHLFSNIEGPASDILDGVVYSLGTFPASTTKYMGVYWCYGDLTVDPVEHTLECDGIGGTNLTQSDSLTADITFYAEQTRNNPDFACNSLIPDQEPVVSDYLNIGDATSEIGHDLVGWSDIWVFGDAGNYGGGSSDSSHRLLMGKGGDFDCGPGSEIATFTMNAGSGTATKLTLEHLDGLVDDSFDVFINDSFVGNYVGGSFSGEIWTTSEFSFGGVTGTVDVKLVATKPANTHCLIWGQVGFSNALLE